jgi:hypothetical protein
VIDHAAGRTPRRLARRRGHDAKASDQFASVPAGLAPRPKPGLLAERVSLGCATVSSKWGRHRAKRLASEMAVSLSLAHCPPRGSNAHHVRIPGSLLAHVTLTYL